MEASCSSVSQNSPLIGGREKNLSTGIPIPIIQSVCFLFSVEFSRKPALLALFSKIVLLTVVLPFKINTMGREILGLHCHGDLSSLT